MDGQRINTGNNTSSTNLLSGSSGLIANDHVMQRMEETLQRYMSDYDAMVKSMRGEEGVKLSKSTEESTSFESNPEYKRAELEFLKIKIDNLNNMLSYIRNQSPQGGPPPIT